MLKALVFGSGGGSNFKSIYKNIQHNHLKLDISCVVSNNSKSGILEFSRENGLKIFHLSQLKYPSLEDYEQAYHDIADEFGCDIVILAGYMKMIPLSFIERFKNKILNIHPSLLPSFGGEGMYGMNVHEAVKVSGVKISGATIHFVSEHYDEGPIILQKSVLLSGSETPEEIGSKVLKVEHTIYSEALDIVINKKYKIEDSRVVLLDRENT